MCEITVDKDILTQWQRIVEIMAKVICVPTAIITRINGTKIEVLKANINENNPYHEGIIVEAANHYCEEVINTKSTLHIKYAPETEKWKNAPELKHNMVSYLGFPVSWPNGDIFGTICVLDQKANSYSEQYKMLIEEFKYLIEAHLTVSIQRFEIAKKNRELEKALKEIKQLQGIIPICSKCKKIRNDRGFWEQVEVYVAAHTNALFSHGLCPTCLKDLYPEYKSKDMRTHFEEES